MIHNILLNVSKGKRLKVDFLLNPKLYPQKCEESEHPQFLNTMRVTLFFYDQ